MAISCFDATCRRVVGQLLTTTASLLHEYIRLHKLLSRLEGSGGKIFLSVARNKKPTL